MNNLKKLREKKGVYQKDVAAYLGVERTTYVKYENGDSEPSFEMLGKLADYFDVSIDYLLGREGKDPVALLGGFPMEKQGRRPIYGTVSAGLGQYVEGDDFLGFETVDAKYNTEDYFYLRVKGNSMAPLIGDGDLLLIHKQEAVDSGELAVLLVDGEEGFVKKIEYGHGVVRLISENPYYPPLCFNGQEAARVRVVGKVVEMKRKF